MAKLTAGLMGYTQGKVAGVQCQRLRDSIILRAKQPPLGPARGGQIAYRAKFAAVMSQNCKPIAPTGTQVFPGNATPVNGRSDSLRFNYAFNKTGITSPCVTYGTHQYGFRMFPGECNLTTTRFVFYAVYDGVPESLATIVAIVQPMRDGSPVRTHFTFGGNGTSGETTWNSDYGITLLSTDKLVISIYGVALGTGTRYLLGNGLFDLKLDPTGLNWWGQIPFGY